MTHLDELERIDVAGVHWRPVRRALGISAFGINAYSADAGEHLIEDHTEEGNGHEEVYLVVRGRAMFTIDGDKREAGPGTLVYLDDPAQRRGAVALEDGTLAVAIGGTPGAAGPPSPWEFFFAAAPALEADDAARAYATAAEGLAPHPDDASLNYNLACYAALAGMTDTALDHLRLAFEKDARTRKWAEDDSDLDSLRDDPRWPG